LDDFRSTRDTLLYLRDVVESEVEILELLHVMQVLHLPNDVVLEVEDLQAAAVAA